jgi:hypothetical protein
MFEVVRRGAGAVGALAAVAIVVALFVTPAPDRSTGAPAAAPKSGASAPVSVSGSHASAASPPG